ncbi:hypothetical protein ACJJTC_001224 [Scirpophaga incertulas]
MPSHNGQAPPLADKLSTHTNKRHVAEERSRRCCIFLSRNTHTKTSDAFIRSPCTSHPAARISLAQPQSVERPRGMGQGEGAGRRRQAHNNLRQAGTGAPCPARQLCRSELYQNRAIFSKS